MKNFFVLAPLLFARHLFDQHLLLTALLAFALFCLLSSSMYLFNDVVDAELDRSHPLKAYRPVAASVIRPAQAIAAGGFLAAAALAVSFFLQTWFGLVGVAYLALNLSYSWWLKRVAFLDVLAIALGFVLRVVGGAVVIEVDISPWLVVCTFCLAYFLGLGKRCHEIETLEGSGSDTRPALAGYSRVSLWVAERILLGITVVFYFMYTLAPGTVAKFHTHNLLFTLPFPIFGLYRYLRLVESKHTRAPTEALVTDLPSWINLAGWVAVVMVVLYGGD